VLFVSDSEIERLISMREAMEAVEEAFKEYARGSAIMPPRSTIMLERFNGSISLMPSYLREAGVLATKIISIYPGNPGRGLPTTAAWLVVNDPETGMMEALMDATYLTALRTGAVTGVAARYLAPRGARIAALIGCGAQGRTQALALDEALRPESLRIHDLSGERMNRFASEMAPRLRCEIIQCGGAMEAVRGADVVVTATTSKEPVIRRRWLGDRVHISAIGSFYPDHREIDTETVREAKVVVDSREAALVEAGDLIIPLREGAIKQDHIYAELGEILTGKKRGRTEEDGLTLFKSVGLAIQDSAVAGLVMKKLSEQRP
jgi:alanine dehydrogenase